MILRSCLIPVVALAVAGCASVDPATLDPEDGWIALRNVPMVRQDAEQTCGAAVLAATLRYWGRPTTLPQVVAECPPDEEGIRAGALRDLARQWGWECFVVRGTRADLEYELSKGRPVIVGTVKRTSRGLLTHYELVVGLRSNREVLLLDPARGWRRKRWSRFLEEWTRAARTTLVLFPGEKA